MNGDRMKNFCCSATILFGGWMSLYWFVRYRKQRNFSHVISRTVQDKQHSSSLSVLLLKAQPVQVIKILLSQGEVPLLLQKHRVEQTATVLCRSLSLLAASFVYLLHLYKMLLSSSPLRLPPDKENMSHNIFMKCLQPHHSWCIIMYYSDKKSSVFN